ncbi:MAG: hypothetical protein RIB86_21170 [Imperialibacter sp.]
MSIEEEKLDLIKWLLEVEDDQIIKQFRTLQKSNEEAILRGTSNEERSAIDRGLATLSKGKSWSHGDVKY